MGKERKKDQWALAAAIGTIVAWGMNFAFVKYILDHLGVGAFMFLRFSVLPLLGFALLAIAFRGRLAHRYFPGVLGNAFHEPGAGGVAGLFWALVVSSFLGWLAWTWVNTVRGVAGSAPFMYLMPPIAGVMAWLTLGESFTWLKIAGAAATMAGVAWAQFGGGRPPPKKPARPTRDDEKSH